MWGAAGRQRQKALNSQWYHWELRLGATTRSPSAQIAPFLLPSPAARSNKDTTQKRPAGTGLRRRFPQAGATSEPGPLAGAPGARRGGPRAFDWGHPGDGPRGPRGRGAAGVSAPGVAGAAYSPAHPCLPGSHTRTAVQEDGAEAAGCGRPPARDTLHALDPGRYHRATPATFEFQRPPPRLTTLRTQDQSSPPPQPRANRRALRRPRPHPRGPHLLLPVSRAAGDAAADPLPPRFFFQGPGHCTSARLARCLRQRWCGRRHANCPPLHVRLRAECNWGGGRGEGRYREGATRAQTKTPTGREAERTPPSGCSGERTR